MNELIDKFLFELFDGLRDKTTVLFGEFIADAQALAEMCIRDSYYNMLNSKPNTINKFIIHIFILLVKTHIHFH